MRISSEEEDLEGNRSPLSVRRRRRRCSPTFPLVILLCAFLLFCGFLFFFLSLTSMGAGSASGNVLLLVLPLMVAGNIPEYYKVSQYFPSENQACSRELVGDRYDIYCSGRLLEAVMALKLFNDSKTFVDRPLKYSPKEVADKFERQFPTYDDLDRDAVSEFVEANFMDAETELEDCELTDWTERPKKLAAIKDNKLREFAFALNGIWKHLCRQIKLDVQENEERHSLIYVPHKFVVPGGRFREFYYWDTYWVIKGLLASEMYETVRNVLSNFAFIVERYGFIPNGGRIYYLARSQPPMLTPMFYEYLEATGDVEFIQRHLPTLEKELNFWDSRRSVPVNVGSETFTMYQYRAESDVPRPESFREDVELVKDRSWDQKNGTWRDLASAAEAGYDFSSRWFRNFTEIGTIDTTNVVEVDLNAFMCWNFDIMSYFHGMVPDGRKKELEYKARYMNFRRGFQRVFYVDNEDGWYDYNIRNRSHNIEFYPSNVAPLFARCYDPLDHLKVEKVYSRIQKFGAFGFNSGIPTSLHKNTGQQWDFPNAWPPLQHMLIEGLRQAESPQLQEHAFEVAKMWTRVNLNTFNQTGVMWEKYDVNGVPGSGGEYTVQAGFGWTNGVVLDLLVSYADRLDYSSVQATADALPIANVPIRARRLPAP